MNLSQPAKHFILACIGLIVFTLGVLAMILYSPLILKHTDSYPLSVTSYGNSSYIHIGQPEQIKTFLLAPGATKEDIAILDAEINVWQRNKDVISMEEHSFPDGRLLRTYRFYIKEDPSEEDRPSGYGKPGAN